jgi:hypothetical protein
MTDATHIDPEFFLKNTNFRPPIHTPEITQSKGHLAAAIHDNPPPHHVAPNSHERRCLMRIHMTIRRLPTN